MHILITERTPAAPWWCRNACVVHAGLASLGVAPTPLPKSTTTNGAAAGRRPARGGGGGAALAVARAAPPAAFLKAMRRG